MRAVITGKGAIVKEGDVNWLQVNFFGDAKDDKLILSPEESVFLLEQKRLELFNNGKKISFSKAIELFSKKINNFFIKYIVYKDLRLKGYVVKTALKYGVDFRVYDKGQVPGKDHSKWLCLVLYEDDLLKAKNLTAIGRIAHTVRKKLLFAIVDAEYDITYYEADWIRLP